MARARCGSGVAEELGRRGSKQKACKLCGGGIENVDHFVAWCPAFDEERSEFMVKYGLDRESLTERVLGCDVTDKRVKPNTKANSYKPSLSFLGKLWEERGNKLHRPKAGSNAPMSAD